MATKTGQLPKAAEKDPRSAQSKARLAIAVRSKVTARGQTTLPSGVRKSLGLGAGTEVAYEIRGDHAVIRKAVEDPEEREDPIVSAFLAFLERDMTEHPENLMPVTQDLAARFYGLTEGVVVDVDERVEGPVAL